MAMIASYLIFAMLLGIKPYDRLAWALENSVPLVEGLAFIIYYRWKKVELTRLTYWLIFGHLIIQCIGGHYTYEKVPLFDWLRDYFGWARNHYDRLAHIALGFCLYIPLREIFLRRTPLNASRAWAGFFTLVTIMAIAGMWEVWEWLVAANAQSDLGNSYLGAQGDPWDAQKDIVLAPIGAVAALFLLTGWHNAALEREKLIPAMSET